LYEIIHHLKKEEADNDLPTINEDSAFGYVKDAFVISNEKHQEIYEQTKTRDSPEIYVDSGDLNDSIDDNCPQMRQESFCSFTPNINNFKAVERHCWLTKILLKHQLESSKTPNFYWEGNFSFLARSILNLHSESKYLTETNIAFTQWAAFIEVHKQHPLNLKVFLDTLDSIVDDSKGVETAVAQKNLLISAKVFIPACFGLIPQPTLAIKAAQSEKPDKLHLRTQDDLIVKMFWDSTNFLYESFTKFVGYLRKESDYDAIKIEILRKIFEIIEKLKKIEGYERSANSFEASLKSYIKFESSKYLSTVINEDALKKENNESKLNNLINFTRAATEDFLKLNERFGKFFDE
jgi:hypothetical protein